MSAASLRIQALGKVREDGREGELVRITNLDSRRELVGRVASDGAVDVSY